MRLGFTLGVGVLLLALAPGLAAGAAPALQPCGRLGARCGVLPRPLDATGRVPGQVGIAFEWYPATGPGPRRGTLVATEGGPGFSARASRGAYLALFAPLRADHDLVLMDNRGTGASGFLDCRWPAGGDLTPARIGACGRRLGARAALYGTADAADDLAALLEALGTGPVDLYGDSYGTFFAQVFALRHPAALRSMVLDGAYPLDGPDIAWLPEYAPAMRDKFARACERDPDCHARSGTPGERLAAALEVLRRTPHASVTPGDFATVLFASAPSELTLREVDAAARAALDGDLRPLERLAGEARTATRGDAIAGDTSFSPTLAAAVSCTDNPSVVDPMLPPRERHAAFLDALEARERAVPAAYAPFRYDEFLGLPADYRYLDQCLDWPTADPAHPPAHRLWGSLPHAPVPTLVISGDLDNITSPAEGEAAAAGWPRATHLVVPNGLHVNALPHGRSRCAAERVRTLIATLKPDPTPCAAPPLRLVPAFVRASAALAPLPPADGDASAEPGRRLAAAVAATVADLWIRRDAPLALRGGHVRREGAMLVLDKVRWCEDVAVSGRIVEGSAAGAGSARLRLRADDGTTGELAMQWEPPGARGGARLDGQVGGRALHARAEAP